MDHFSQLPPAFSSSCSRVDLAQNTGTANFAYKQGFQWGTNLSVGFNNTRSTTNSFVSKPESQFELQVSVPV